MDKSNMLFHLMKNLGEALAILILRFVPQPKKANLRTFMDNIILHIMNKDQTTIDI